MTYKDITSIGCRRPTKEKLNAYRSANGMTWEEFFEQLVIRLEEETGGD